MQFTVERGEHAWVARFTAMASPCEVHISCEDKSEAKRLASLAVEETRRIEQKFSRYRDDNIVYAINTSQGRPIDIDAETYQLLQFAGQCYELSGGLFDITSGVLRTAWKFDGREADPDHKKIENLLARVGWPRVRLTETDFALQSGMEIDFGGIGKEYAVDRVAQNLFAEGECAVMINFGGDIRVISPESHERPWVIGIEDPGLEDTALGQVELNNGAVATSGDSRRYCVHKGKRLGHILNPKTGWPIEGAPRSVTVLGGTCVEAGLLSTLAMLQGAEAEEFLKDQDTQYHCVW
jgi:thiamine biosynthesis lipoprotein